MADVMRATALLRSWEIHLGCGARHSHLPSGTRGIALLGCGRAFRLAFPTAPLSYGSTNQGVGAAQRRIGSVGRLRLKKIRIRSGDTALVALSTSFRSGLVFAVFLRWVFFQIVQGGVLKVQATR